jgi:hypothetical protein
MNTKLVVPVESGLFVVVVSLVGCLAAAEQNKGNRWAVVVVSLDPREAGIHMHFVHDFVHGLCICSEGESADKK